VSGPADVAARRDRAVAAAVRAARAAGLDVGEPRVLYDVFSVVVHLVPAPVVVRVPTVLPRTVRADRPAQVRQQRAELAVADWLAGVGHPVVRPTPLLPREPLAADGYSMTAWELVAEVPGPVGEEASGAAVARLHAALADCPVELDWWFPLDASVPDGLDQLRAERPGYLTADDLARADREWELMAPLADDPARFAAAFPAARVQAVHGDAPFYNLIPTAAGPLVSDLEHVTRAPREWDLAGVPAGVRAGHDATVAELGLPPLDDRLLRVAERGRALQMLAVLALGGELPVMVDALEPFVGEWRDGPALDGLLAGP
jgi:hypothetical protein